MANRKQEKEPHATLLVKVLSPASDDGVEMEVEAVGCGNCLHEGLVWLFRTCEPFRKQVLDAHAEAVLLDAAEEGDND